MKEQVELPVAEESENAVSDDTTSIVEPAVKTPKVRKNFKKDTSKQTEKPDEEKPEKIVEPG